MAKQSNWNYCKDTTNQHHLAIKFTDCVEKIHDVTIAEGSKNSPFKKEICINLDKVEGKLAQKEKRNARKTMDISFGLKKDKQKQILLCEYRLRYKNINNLKKSELDSKISNSTNLLGHSPVIHNCYLFIFSPSIKSQAYRYIRRLYSNKNIVNVMDIHDLKRVYFN